MTDSAKKIAAVLAVLALMVPGLPAVADNAPDPHVLTCGQILAPETQDQRIIANMMVVWTVGYFYGRFGAVETANMTAERYQQNVQDFVGALQQICPNVPDMTIADFTANLAGDFAESAGIAE